MAYCLQEYECFSPSYVILKINKNLSMVLKINEQSLSMILFKNKNNDKSGNDRNLCTRGM